MLSQIQLVSAIAEEVSRQGLPDVNTRQFNAMIKAADLIAKEFADPHRPAVPDSGMVAWLLSDETGASSLTMASHLGRIAGIKDAPFRHESDHPHDPSDLARCLGLLAAVPELRQQLSRMAEVSPTWAALAAAWGELEGLYREESPTKNAPKLYRRMREIIEAAGDGRATR